SRSWNDASEIEAVRAAARNPDEISADERSSSTERGPRGDSVNQAPYSMRPGGWAALSMNLDQLRYFVAVAEELHFRRAAERLRISQPPLSFHIKALEAEVGTVLLNRTSRQVSLTEAGVALLEKSRKVLAAVAEAERAVKDVQ